MALVVQKFGGTSVADAAKIKAAAAKAVARHDAGDRVVVVVSAMGHQTDLLVDLAGQITAQPSAREMDMLLSTGEQVSVALFAMAIHALGREAVSLTGSQIGIRTDSRHGKARIKSISTTKVAKILEGGAIVIAAGFQGTDQHGNITTLGRGGSDTTAVALAAVLGADRCEIYTDVEGIYTTDPRILPAARRLSSIAYEEMLELASLGAGVMHARSIEFAKKFGVPVMVRSSFKDGPSTMILPADRAKPRPASGIALARDEARITLEDVPDEPGTSHAVFSALAAAGITVDMIVQNAGQGGQTDISFTVASDDFQEAAAVSRRVAAELGAGGISCDDDVAKVSAVGVGMAREEGVAGRMFQAVAAAGINVRMITTSEIKISALVDRADANAAVAAVHAAFGLETPSPAEVAEGSLEEGPKPSPLEVVRRLKGMEDLAIEDCVLDSSQALVTIVGLPDTPGAAAEIFAAAAAAGLFVDMIVQSHPRNGRAEISFTVPAGDAERAAEAARTAAAAHGATVADVPHVAKLSITGVGIRSHAGVADRLFKPLTDAGINIDLVNTSETRLNVIVAAKHGKKSLRVLRKAFGLPAAKSS
ncbi:MAG: aspartate kinase [Planctomycetota bacterium]|jgi:aspartate kinase|nr:aspartate kinase [Planctomycetota bacterium]MDA1040837.1 aspartate kinase [Planctomycetota bacterium]